MKRANPPKKKQEKQPKLSTHFIMSVIMPCVMLACKDKFKIKAKKDMDDLAERIERYVGYIADGKVTVGQLHSMIEVIDNGNSALTGAVKQNR